MYENYIYLLSVDVVVAAAVVSDVVDGRVVVVEAMHTTSTAHDDAKRMYSLTVKYIVTLRKYLFLS